jgi:ABC-2 type transport system permease protein
VSAKPGSALWLLKHEVRLFWYNLALTARKGKAPRRVDKLGLAMWAFVWAVLHAGAWALLSKASGAAATAPSPPLLLGITILFCAAFMFMLSSGLKASVEVMFERGDLDLLLSSPLSSRSIFSVRLAGMVVGIASLYLFFLAPLANAGLVLGQFRWLGIYPTILGASAIAAALSMLLTLGLVRLLGARRTRVVAQVVGALAGALLFLLSQVYAFASRGSANEPAGRLAQSLLLDSRFGPDSPLWLPARAALGQPGPLLGLSLVAAALLLLTVRFTHRFFVLGLQQAASTGRAAKAPRGGVRYRFGRSLPHVVLVKEWRLIARDPQLISQVLLQLLYMLPLCALLFTSGSSPVPAAATGLTMLSGSLAASLAWIVILAEDAPDLLLASPAAGRTIRYAKLAAAAVPPLALIAAPLLWLVVHNSLAGVLTSFTVVGSVFSAVLIVMWCGRPAARSDFKTRGKVNLMGHLLEIANLFAWTGLAYLLLGSSVGPIPSDTKALGAAAVFGAVLGILLLAWLRRSKP